MTIIRLIAIAGAGLALGTSQVALAATDEDWAVVSLLGELAPDQIGSAMSDDLGLGIDIVEPSPFGASAIDDGALSRIAGREDTNQIAYADQVAGVTKNTIGDNSTTGAAKISDNAFQNMSGLSILNVNTGNNVAINAAMNVNISFNAQP